MIITQVQLVKQYMRRLITTQPDEMLDCGEVNTTALGEWAIDEYSLDASDGAPVWDWAFEVSQEYESELKR